MNTVVPICLYRYVNTPELNYIGFPNMVNTGGKVVYSCQEKENLEFVTMLYVINPDFRPFPQGTMMFCATSTDVMTIGFDMLYDMFNDKSGCVRFIAWDKPVPNTVRVSVRTVPNGISVSVGGGNTTTERNETVFYTLLDPRESQNGHFPIVDNIPEFRFSNHDGRCVPDPKGTLLQECMANSVIQMTRDTRPTLLSYLNGRYVVKLPSDTVFFVSFAVGFALVIAIMFFIIRRP